MDKQKILAYFSDSLYYVYVVHTGSRLMYKCDCGSPLCNIDVSRSTRYRHQLAKTLQADLDRQPFVDNTPLPVEDVLPAPPVEIKVLNTVLKKIILYIIRSDVLMLA